MSERPTPRTDAAAIAIWGDYAESEDNAGEWVKAGFARTLERQLAAALDGEQLMTAARDKFLDWGYALSKKLAVVTAERDALREWADKAWWDDVVTIPPHLCRKDGAE